MRGLQLDVSTTSTPRTHASYNVSDSACQQQNSLPLRTHARVATGYQFPALCQCLASTPRTRAGCNVKSSYMSSKRVSSTPRTRAGCNRYILRWWISTRILRSTAYHLPCQRHIKFLMITVILVRIPRGIDGDI